MLQQGQKQVTLLQGFSTQQLQAVVQQVQPTLPVQVALVQQLGVQLTNPARSHCQTPGLLKQVAIAKPLWLL